MNYIELLNCFYELLQCSRVSNNAQLLYYTLLQINNKCSWSDWFSRTNVSISGMMCISESAFTNARAELKQFGLIDFIPSKRRGECTKYSILYPTKQGTKEVQKEYKRSTEGVQTEDLNKPKPKLKPKKKYTDVSEKNVKHKCGEYGHVSLSDDEISKLTTEFGDMVKDAIKYLDEYVEMKGYKHNSSYLAIRKWVITAVKEQRNKLSQVTSVQKPKQTGFQNFEQRETDYDAMVLARLNERLGGNKDQPPVQQSCDN